MDLTAEQLKIVRHGEGHARVSAVAGSGKTTTMIGRIGHLLKKGVRADALLVLMFNRSARDGFVRTMEQQLKEYAPLPEIRTFHSLGLRLVTSFVRRGALPPFTLVTKEYVQEKLAKQVAVQLSSRENGGHVSKEDTQEFLTYIDQVKATVESADTVFHRLGLAGRNTWFIKGFSLFEKVRRERKIRFYNDLIHEPLLAMRDDPCLAKWVANRVDHIIVDEYQDINEVQQQLLIILAGTRGRVMVVGDADQCIYEWRGARPDFIVSRFQRDFPCPVNYTLSRTFRFGHRLSLAADHLIHHNILRDRKLCISAPSTPDTRISFLEEKKKHPVVPVLEHWKKQGRRFGEAAVLVRLYAHSVPVELALLEAGIPYTLEGHERVFGCDEIIALLGYLQLFLGVLGAQPEEKTFRTVVAMLSQPHLGVGQKDIERLARQIVHHPGMGAEMIERAVAESMPVFIQKRFVNSAENWRWISALSSDLSTGLLLRKIIEKLDLYSFYAGFSEKNVTVENRVKTCEAFIDFADGKKLTPGQFLKKVEALDSPDNRSGEKGVFITSIHRAKGLEWPLVVIPGLEEGSFPFFQDMSGGENLEDERRLFYVAMTRAVERVVFIYPPDNLLKKVLKRGRGHIPGESIRASRFLYEANILFSDHLGEAIFREDGEAGKLLSRIAERAVSEKYLQAMNIKFKEIEKKQDNNGLCRWTDNKILQIDEISEGLAVWHEKFGHGTVTAVRDRKQGRLQVLFADHGEMILLARYARLRLPARDIC
jgi:DNA helicase-2/ATP-dependent DNA helicase PcrA